MKIFTYSGVVEEIRTEDGTCAKIAEITDPILIDKDDGVFFRFHSWVEDGGDENHKEFNEFMKEGKKVKIIMEIEN